jgi:hypothetical protein
VPASQQLNREFLGELEVSWLLAPSHPEAELLETEA